MRVLLVVLLAVLSPSLSSAASLTLDDCLERGKNFNYEINAYKLAVEEADYSIYEAKGAFLPTLSFSYNQSEVLDSKGQGLQNDYFDQTSESFSARVTQPLFAGFSGVAGLEKAKQSKGYREYQLKYVSTQLMKEVRSSYYDILRARSLTEKWQNSVGRLESQSEIAQAWVKQDLAPRVRLLEVDVELSNARHQLTIAETNQLIAVAKMKELLAFPQEEELDILGSLRSDIVNPCASVEVCSDQALQQRADLKMLEMNIEMARQDARAILAKNLPRINLDASWNDYQRDYDNRLVPNDDRSYYSVVLGVSVQPFQGGRNIAAWKRQQIAITRNQSLKDSLHQTILAEVYTRYEQLEQSYGLLTTANESLNEANEVYQLVKRSAALGVVSLKDLIDAELRLTRAEVNQIESFYSLNQARSQLDFALGN